MDSLEPGFFCWEKKPQYSITSNEIMLGFLKDFLEKATDQGIFFGVSIDGKVCKRNNVTTRLKITSTPKLLVKSKKYPCLLEKEEQLFLKSKKKLTEIANFQNHRRWQLGKKTYCFSRGPMCL